MPKLETYKTRHEWANEGRIVKSNSRPRKFLYSGDGSVNLGLYTEAQTLDRQAIPVVDRDDRPGSGKGTIRYRYDGETLYVYVGPRKDLIAVLKKRGFQWVGGRVMRWRRKTTPKQLDGFIKTFTNRGYTLYREDSV